MDNQRKRSEALVEKALNELSEHFDTIRIFITEKSETDTENWIAYSKGRGNIYAQIGQIDDWLVRQRERTMIDERKAEDGDDCE